MAKVSAQKLEDIVVDRLDAVDDPASRRRWLIVKSFDQHKEISMDPVQLEKAALALLESLKAQVADAGLKFGAEFAAMLNALAKSLGLPEDFVASEPVEEQKASDDQPDDKQVADAQKAEGDQPAGGEPPVASESAEVAALKKMVEEMSAKLAELSAKVMESAKTADDGSPPPPPPPSTQPSGGEHAAKRAPKKMGEGVFTNFFQR